MVKSKPSVAERIAERLFKTCGDARLQSTHLMPTRYQPFLMRGSPWTKAGVIAVIESELKAEQRRVKSLRTRILQKEKP